MPGRTLILSKLGNALSFNGTTTTAQRSVLSTSTGDWSAFCWIYLSGTPGSTLTILKNGETGSGNGGWNFSITSASKLNLKDPGGVWGGTGTSVLSNTTWYHVGFIRTGTSTQMYLNGVAEGSVVTGSFNNPNIDFTVGCTRNSSSGAYSAFFNGNIDDVRVWTRAISSNELSYIYNQDQLNSPSLANMQAWYKFDESSGNAADSSGNSRTLTVTNGSYVTGHAYIANIPARTTSAARTTAGARTAVST